MSELLYDLTKINPTYEQLLVENNINKQYVLNIFNIKLLEYLCKNPTPNGVNYLKENIHKLSRICWNILCESHSKLAMEFLSFGLSQGIKINWQLLSKNTSRHAIKILLNNVNNIHWNSLCLNSSIHAIRILLDNRDNINWRVFSKNPSPVAVHILLNNLNKVCWREFSKNPAKEAVAYLNDNRNKIVWDAICQNPSPDVVKIICENCNKINWREYLANITSDGLKILWKTLFTIDQVHSVDENNLTVLLERIKKERNGVNNGLAYFDIYEPNKKIEQLNMNIGEIYTNLTSITNKFKTIVFDKYSDNIDETIRNKYTKLFENYTENLFGENDNIVVNYWDAAASSLSCDSDRDTFVNYPNEIDTLLEEYKHKVYTLFDLIITTHIEIENINNMLSIICDTVVEENPQYKNDNSTEIYIMEFDIYCIDNWYMLIYNKSEIETNLLCKIDNIFSVYFNPTESNIGKFPLSCDACVHHFSRVDLNKNSKYFCIEFIFKFLNNRVHRAPKNLLKALEDKNLINWANIIDGTPITDIEQYICTKRSIDDVSIWQTFMVYCNDLNKYIDKTKSPMFDWDTYIKLNESAYKTLCSYNYKNLVVWPCNAFCNELGIDMLKPKVSLLPV